MGKRKWEKEMKREMIADSAMELFINKGLTNVSLKEIADQVGYSKSSIYSYFNSKEDIIIFLIEKSLKDIKSLFDEIEEIANNNNEEKDLLNYVLENKMENITKDDNMTKLIHKNHKEFLKIFSDNDKLINMMVDIREYQLKITKRLISQYVKNEDELILYSNFLIDIFHSINHYKYFTDKPISDKEIGDKLKKFILFGLKGNK